MKKIDFYPYILVAPTLVFLIVLVFYPALYTVYLSVHEVSFITVGKYLGLRSFSRRLADPRVWNSIKVGFTYTFGTMAGSVLLGFILANVLNMDIWGRRFFRTVILVPWVITEIVSMTQVKWMVNYDYGLINQFRRGLGLGPIEFLGDPVYAMLTVIGANIWRSTAFAMVLILAALQTIPRHLYEASQLDGASAVRQAISITLPLIRMTLLILAIVLTMSYFTRIVPIMVLTGGGPGAATEIIGLKMYDEAFIQFRMNDAAVLGVILFVINLVMAIIYYRVLATKESLY